MFSLVRFVAVSLALFGAAEAAPNLLSIASVTGPTRPGGYIVTLKQGAVAQRTLSSVRQTLLDSFSTADSQIKYEWPNLNAFAGTFSDAALLALRSSADVVAIEHDTVGGEAELVSQTDAPWGLQRISHVERLRSTNFSALDYTYVYDESAGKGVDIYIIDSGIAVEHHDFEGRARWGTTVGGYPEVDGSGHGTHVAGIAAGKRFGVAKSANLIAVRVLDDIGNGVVSDAIAGVNWVLEQVTTTTHAPSVINMSLQFPVSDALNAALTTAIDAGIHVVVAAGNFAKDAGNYSPSSTPAAITVGATTIEDTVAYYSNIGPVVDIFAPGDNVMSALSTSEDDYVLKSGTSMATPHVAGLVAYLVALEGNKPLAEILARIKEFSPDGLISDMPENTNNEIADNGATL